MKTKDTMKTEDVDKPQADFWALRESIREALRKCKGRFWLEGLTVEDTGSIAILTLSSIPAGDTQTKKAIVRSLTKAGLLDSVLDDREYFHTHFEQTFHQIVFRLKREQHSRSS